MTLGASKYDPIAVSSESTVVAEYLGDAKRVDAYQSEAQLEREFIRLLQSQAYEYLPITSEAELIANLRTQLERLNNIEFSNDEWKRFFEEKIASASDGPREKTTRIQEDHVQLLRRDDGTTKNITLIDKVNIHNNRLQVINQYELERGEGGAKYANRYDATVLVNGLPMVHIELKRRGVHIREAFNQINRYSRDSFWAGSGLFDYVQLFVISNGTHTKYYANTVRRSHLEEQTRRRSRRSTSNSFEFTSWWADGNNRPIQDLIAFTKTFFAKHSLLNVLTKYCVLTADQQLLVMRPYQIVATERILRRIDIATNYKKLGSVDAGGYIWHTTGSGKTLTSFKTAQLATQQHSVDKVLFVVDRKDLDHQTMREYDRFQKGAANSNTSTRVLQQQLEDPAAKIIITTIQKLSNFVQGNKGHEIFSGHVVIIFDECHRSQFGDMHREITKAFKRYNLFGFTGTPIFAQNAPTGGNPRMRTTEQVFGEKLHTYTVVDAINDKNVLPFRIDYVDTVRVGKVADKQVAAIDTERALLAPERVSKIVTYIREHFNQKTKRASSYALGERHVRGFNSLFATASIQAARAYYNEFKRQQQEVIPAERLKIGIIYSYAPNEELIEGFLDEEQFETSGLGLDDRTFLEEAITDYNAMFGTNFHTSGDSFENYYRDLSHRLRNRDLDMLIVVNMFLTGFDATTLNTLWVDKNLRMHGLIQAYSRTNRILNTVKTYGNVVSFRNLEHETNEAIALFGNKDAGGIVLLKPYSEYYGTYTSKINELLEAFPLGQPIVGETAQKDFIRLFGEILRLLNILTAFDEFAGNDVLSPRQHQDYKSVYLDLYNEFKGASEAQKESINDDVIFEMELVKQVEINVDYILMLVERNREKFGTGEDKEVRAEISRSIDSSPSLRNKKDLIENFVDRLSATGTVDEDWSEYIAEQKEKELATIISEENLKPEETRRFVDDAFEDGEITTSGTTVAGIFPPMSRFSPDQAYGQKRTRVLERLGQFFERFFGLFSAGDS